MQRFALQTAQIQKILNKIFLLQRFALQLQTVQIQKVTLNNFFSIANGSNTVQIQKVILKKRCLIYNLRIIAVASQNERQQVYTRCMLNFLGQKMLFRANEITL